MADQQQSMDRKRIQALITRLLSKISDEDLRKMQSEIDELEERAADGHHDHDHPTVTAIPSVEAVRKIG
jgi:hypothetical protein